ncbi:MAG: response regulator transcription factor [Sinobacteraceae bacterium]|nr:response regulator transcription factor [Nevskiaceae bacterium]
MSAPVSPTRLLIVDDHESVRAGLRFVLSGEPDFQIVGEASSVAAALRAIDELTPDVVLLDFGLGAENGDVVLDVLATRPNPPRVVMLSMEDERVVGQEMARRGAADYIMKQEPTAEILAALQRVRVSLLSVDVRGADIPGVPAPPAQTLPPGLTKREREVLLLVKNGLPSKSIARALNISDKTVDVHKHQLRRKLGLRSDLELVRHAALFVTDETPGRQAKPRSSRSR